MVLLTEKYSLRAASCCNVEVVNGAVGDFLAGLVSKSATVNSALMCLFKNASASSLVSKALGSLAFTNFPSEVTNSAVILNEAKGVKS